MVSCNPPLCSWRTVIVVPSIAIKEGVVSSIRITKDHFATLYENTVFDSCVYSSKEKNQLRNFAVSPTVQILIINIDAFRKLLKEDKTNEKTSNVIHREAENGIRPIDYIQNCHPIVIIDEPQSVDNTDKAKEALETLNPLCTLRYSATHRNPYNLLYRLDPIRAYEMRLVKQIEVSSVVSDGHFNTPFLRLISVDNTKGLKAKITLHVDGKTGPKTKTVAVKPDDDLYIKSDEREQYRHNFIVNEISAEPGNEYVKFNGGLSIKLGQTLGDLSDDVMKYQIRKTIEEHLDKEIKMRPHGIKVLSLFFIDRVANYRHYDDAGQPAPGKFAVWFTEILNEFLKLSKYKDLYKDPIEKLHDGYFAQDKKHVLKDTGGDSQADEEVYDKIMRNKEQLLSMDEPLRFIFSHSALREGWDNPNVFQICTLNETNSEIKKRQEIGRGLRLPLNQNGDRVFDDRINRLTVIANESYEDFAKKLQSELEDDFGYLFGRVSVESFRRIVLARGDVEEELSAQQSAELWQALKEQGMIDGDGRIQAKFDPTEKNFDLQMPQGLESVKNEVIDCLERMRLKGYVVDKSKKRTLKLNKQIYIDDDFRILWEKIKHKTTYSVVYDTGDLVQAAVRAIKAMPRVAQPKLSWVQAEILMDESIGVSTKERRAATEHVEYSVPLPDLLAYLQKATELTRATLVKILQESGRLAEFPVNPQKFMTQVADCLNKALHSLIIDGIKYEKIAGQEWEMQLLENEESREFFDSVITVKKSLFSEVIYESEVERRFAQELDERKDIKFFFKLPRWFQVTTPVGEYNPDWAIVKENGGKVYLVRETKSTRDFEKLRNSEAQKVRCGRRHFEALGTGFEVVTKAAEV
ncbi:MAG: type III restriction endonuclease subunit R [Deltaproteobacteria bacterium]|nr:type III restriction endonuclease subunit R [Deltaproteobacteria bacterium]